MIGKKLAHFEIENLLGAGGMGEVYQARDTKLGRNVALKVLPEAFVADADRVLRFEREAKMLASLNHPNIASLHGVEEVDGRHILVMELVEGETLADRIRRGPIRFEEALHIGHQIAEALEAAHERGVVHRDLKPANVKITPDDKVKVLDFGLAKAMEHAPVNATLSNSPTLSMAATQAGVILGTAAYMSPEQAKGFQTDSRGDIFSFGCVLYEMLTGRQAFHGDTAAEVLASVLVRDVEWSFLPPNLNPRIYDLLRRCLEKNPKRRWQSTTDMRAELEAIAREPRPPSIQASPAITRNYWKAAAVLFFFGMIVIAAAAWFVYPRQAEQRVIRFNVSAPEKTALMRNEGFVGSEGFAVSPDGGNFAFLTRDVKSQLWVQPVDSITPRPIPNTDDVANTNFFWSDDSRSIAFVAQGRLKRVDVYGGPGQTICNAATLRGGTWNSKGEILFAMDNGPIYRVPATGGSPRPVTKLENESSHRSPRFLPDGRHFLYLVIGSDVPTVSVGDIMTGSTKRLFAADTGAIYVPQGFVLFIRQGILLAQEFDAAKLEMIGDPKPLAESVSYALGGQNLGLASFSASTNGILTYRSGTSNLLDNVRLTWVDRSGKELGQVGKADPYRGVDLSPDGKKLAVHRHDGTGGDLWVFESQRPTPSRLTFDASQENASPIWSPDGKQIAFGSLRAGMWGIYQKTADGSGDERQLFQSKLPIMPMSWAPDSQSLVFWQRDKSSDLWTLPLNDPKKAQPFLNSGFNESHGQVSPDGKWISYNSNESGQGEIYVRPFPSGPGKWQVSTNGGSFSRWRPDGKEIFYMSAPGNKKLMSVEVKTSGSTFAYETAKELFDSQYVNYGHGLNYHTFGVSPDGQRFLIPRPVESQSDTSSNSMIVVLNWTSLLKK